MGLPKILADRVPNRGSEGLTVDEKGHVFALIQSPLNVDGKTAKTAKMCIRDRSGLKWRRSMTAS